MKKEELLAIAEEAAKNIKTEHDLNELSQMLSRITIESLNSVIRKTTKKRELFPTDDSAKKVVYPAIQQTLKKWAIPIRNWKTALNRFIPLKEDTEVIEFEERLTDCI